MSCVRLFFCNHHSMDLHKHLVPAVLNNLGKYVNPAFHSLYHLTLDYMGGQVISAQNMDWALMSRCWLVGLAWAALSTAVGLFFFSRREIN